MRERGSERARERERLAMNKSKVAKDQLAIAKDQMTMNIFLVMAI